MVLIASAQVPLAADHVVVIEQQHDFGDHRGLVDQQRQAVLIEGRARRVRGRSTEMTSRRDGRPRADLVLYSGRSVLNLEAC